MSISPVNSLSIYEYYYTMNRKKASPINQELQKYGIEPTDDEALNIALLEKAKRSENILNKSQENTQESYIDRPWADLMLQLNITFNKDPADDIEDIKNELDKLLVGVADEELEKEVNDLKNYAQDLYVDYKNINLTSVDTSTTLTTQLNTIAVYNIARI